MPLSLFFPPRGCSSDAGKKVCNTCPVWQQCLRDTLAIEVSGARHGVFGGMSANERKVFDQEGEPWAV
ncbi:WhiB family transcriptional regulator [Mycobacterium colombiense]|nr:WhiB family transcriptional regulator [Mycobacterium colombiense]